MFITTILYGESQFAMFYVEMAIGILYMDGWTAVSGYSSDEQKLMHVEYVASNATTNFGIRHELHLCVGMGWPGKINRALNIGNGIFIRLSTVFTCDACDC